MSNRGMTLDRLADRVLERSSRKADFLVPAAKMALRINDERDLALRTPDGPLGDCGLTDLAFGQLCSTLDLPKRYANRLRDSDNLDERLLLPQSLQTLARNAGSKHLVRTFGHPDRVPGDGAQVRAILSDRYRRIDNEEVVERVIPAIPGDVSVVSANVSDNYLYLKFVRETDLEVDDKFGGLRLGVVVKNSEVGLAALSVRPMLLRLVCLNGMTTTLGQRFVHLGERLSDDGLVPYSDETRALEDAALMAKVSEAVAWSLSDETADALLTQVNAAADSTRMNRPDQAVERLADRYDLTDGQQGNVLRALAEGGDLSRWGLANALTRAAQDEPSYDSRQDMEQMGGKTMALPEREWNALVA